MYIRRQLPIPIEYGHIVRARQNIGSKIFRTPVAKSTNLTSLAGHDVYLKLENYQLTGSFKIRGATHAIGNLSQLHRTNGVVGLSTGNHGRGLAYAARQAGVKCTICMSRLVPLNKIEAIKQLDAKVLIHGDSQDEAYEKVVELVREKKMYFIPPFDDFDIITGQGTIGIEIMEQVPDVKVVVVPVSGGGLISGIAAAIKHRKPNVRIIGVSMERGAAMHESLKAGHPIEVEELTTLADSLGGGIGLTNRYTFNIVQNLVEEVVVVPERKIADAINYAYWCEGQIVEGGGAVGIASTLTGKTMPDGPMVILLSGANIDIDRHYKIISKDYGN